VDHISLSLGRSWESTNPTGSLPKLKLM